MPDIKVISTEVNRELSRDEKLLLLEKLFLEKKSNSLT